MMCFLAASLALTFISQALALPALPMLKGKSRMSEIELETAETGYAPVQIYDDHGLQAYGKKAEDYGSYGHGDKGYKDYYGDTGYGAHGLNKYSDTHDSDHYGAQSGSKGHQYGQGLWTRNRGYGYEKHYAYDKELSTSKFGGAHDDHKSHYGAHDHSATDKVNAYDKYGHNKYGGHQGHENQDYGKYGHLLDSYGKKSYGHSAHTQPVATYHAPAPVYVETVAAPPPAAAHVYSHPPKAISTVYHTKSVPQYQPALPTPALYQTIGDAYGQGIAYY